jgi:DNA-binding transcriptional MerR regulator
MLIGELVEKSGLSKDTIRFYEKKGLISLDKRSRRDNNYKEYPEQVLNKLLLIRKVKEMGFTLNEIDTFFSLWQDEDASCDNLKFTLENKIKAVDHEMVKLSELKSRLVSSLDKCNAEDCEFEKTIPSCICK